MTGIDAFRRSTREWLAANCPPGARGLGPVSPVLDVRAELDAPDARLWLERMAAKGWTAPLWPVEYGGGGLDRAEYSVLVEEMRRIDARFPPIGVAAPLIGAALLEFGTDEQRLRHLPPTARGERVWCQGFSEPGAGSDLASLSASALDRGDHFLVNGRKTWTSGAQFADWMYALLRTDARAPKHEGISLLLVDLRQPGITVRPMRLLHGDSLFCETVFEDAVAPKEDLVGEVNDGWTVGRRLMQHERGSVAVFGGSGAGRGGPRLEDEAKTCAGESSGRIADAGLRRRVLRYNINSAAFALTRRRAEEESGARRTLGGHAASLFKVCASELQQEKSALRVSMRGTEGVGWSGDAFGSRARRNARAWLWSYALSIGGGTNEIQRDVLARRVLGLPD